MRESTTINTAFAKRLLSNDNVNSFLPQNIPSNLVRFLLYTETDYHLRNSILTHISTLIYKEVHKQDLHLIDSYRKLMIILSIKDNYVAVLKNSFYSSFSRTSYSPKQIVDFIKNSESFWY